MRWATTMLMSLAMSAAAGAEAKLAKSTRLPGSLPVFYHFYPSTRFWNSDFQKKKLVFLTNCVFNKYRRNSQTNKSFYEL